MTEKDRELYELMLKIGNERFGSICKHEKIKGNTCVKCLRKVIIDAMIKESNKR